MYELVCLSSVGVMYPPGGAHALVSQILVILTVRLTCRSYPPLVVGSNLQTPYLPYPTLLSPVPPFITLLALGHSSVEATCKCSHSDLVTLTGYIV